MSLHCPSIMPQPRLGAASQKTCMGSSHRGVYRVTALAIRSLRAFTVRITIGSSGS